MSACAGPAGLAHSALLYRGEQQYLDGVAPFVQAGLCNDEPALVSVPADKLALLHDALNEQAAAVTFLDATAAGRNPAALLGMQAAFLAMHPGRPVRMVGEVMWPGRTADEYPGVIQHEALFDSAFAGRAITGLCPYDADRLGDDVLAEARATHQVVWQNGKPEPSTDYAPEAAWARHNLPLPGDAAAITCQVADFADLSAARSFAARHGRQLGLAPDRIPDLQLIVTELATNSLQYADGCCRLALWRRGGHVVCQASDNGRLDNPLAGRLPPSADVVGGHGLLVIHRIADLVRTYAGPTGTTMQIYLRLHPPAEVTA